MKKGFTMVELLIVLGMTAILMMAIGAAFQAATNYTNRAPERLQSFQAEQLIDHEIHNLLEGAYLNDAIDDTNTYFISNADTDSGTAATSITFTTIADGPDRGLLRSEETDFELLNQTFGPQGGVTEVSLSTLPVGLDSAGEGLFLRTQTPSDGDFTQGGKERLLVDGAIDLRFEFWDGFDWVTTWDTRASDRRLPAAVRISYALQDGGDTFSQVIRLLNSDITTNDPLTVGGTAQ